MRLPLTPTVEAPVIRRFVPALVVAACAGMLISCGKPDQAPATSSADAKPAPATSAPAPTSGESRNERTGPGGSGRTTAAARAPKPETPAWNDVTIPAGTSLTVSLVSAIASDTSSTEEEVRAKVAEPITVDGLTVVPKGATVTGVVTDLRRSGRVQGRASLALRFDRLRIADTSYTVEAAPISRTAAATKGEDAKKIGIGAGAGALISAVAGGGKGALVGSMVGAGAGTGVALATRGQEVRLASGTRLTTTLQSPLTVKVPVGG